MRATESLKGRLIAAATAWIAFGMVAAWLVLSAVLTSRVAGIDAWLALPWGTVISATLALTGHFLLGRLVSFTTELFQQIPHLIG